MTMDFINSLIDASSLYKRYAPRNHNFLLGMWSCSNLEMALRTLKEIHSLDVPEMQMVPAEAGRKRYRVIKGGGT